MLRVILMDRYGEVRVHWRIAAAIFLMTLCITAALFGSAALGWTNILGLATGALAGGILASWLLTRFLNHKPLAAIGVGVVPNPLPDLVLGIALGVVAIALISLAFWLPGYVRFSWREIPAGEFVRVAVFAFASATVAAASEEVIFRGYLFQTLAQGISLFPASLIMSAFFAAAHRWNPGFTALGGLNVGLAGLLFSVAYAKTGRLWLPLGIHCGWNFSQLTLAGYPQSGLLDPDRMLCTVTITGPDWWTGGAFGPEGGLAATVALTGCAWFVLKTSRFRRPTGLVTLDSLEDLVTISKN